jgi:hypothetical protein
MIGGLFVLWGGRMREMKWKETKMLRWKMWMNIETKMATKVKGTETRTRTNTPKKHPLVSVPVAFENERTPVLTIPMTLIQATEVGPRPPTARQKKFCHEAFTLIFHEASAEDLPKKRIGIEDVQSGEVNWGEVEA